MSGNCCTNCCYGCLYFTQQIYENYIKNNRPVQIILGVIGGMLLMVILLAIFGAFRSTACATYDDDHFYYNMFTKSWAQTTCKEFENHPPGTIKRECIDLTILPKALTIHGLWPQLRGKASHLVDCEDHTNQYDPAKIADLVTSLNTQWPSVEKLPDSNQVLWRRQWDRHGTCSVYELKKYFELNLQLDTNYPVSKWLEEANIKPTNANPYTVDEIKKALDPKVGADQYLLFCSTFQFDKVVGNNTEKVTQVWLRDVRMCVLYGDSVKATKCVLDKVPNQDQLCKDKIYYVADYTTMKPT